ncbi:GNRR2-like protein [Mya arenaria]|uniref:GNRR2-like protein n=1 Tax=Mya arenaria TaxID=6604 RepID=A0ABY7F706_MYAAR|nr:GNRR2-like protein [Mya arenaria]
MESKNICFILWLGWIDLVVCTVVMPLLIINMLFPYMFPSEAACKTLRFLHVFFVVASAFIVITIAIERHRRICNPFSPEMSTRKIKIMCALAFVLGCFVALPEIFVYGGTIVETGVKNINGTECFIDPRMKDSREHVQRPGPALQKRPKRKTKDSFAESDSDMELVNDTNRGTEKQNGTTIGNAPNSSENSSARFSLDNSDSKKDPYGKLFGCVNAQISAEEQRK